jgi:ribonuclease HI
MNELSDEDDVDAEASELGDHTDDIDGPLGVIGAPLPRAEPRAGTGRVFPTKFSTSNPSDTPQTLFPLRRTENATPPVYRFIRRNGETQFLIYTDGACLDNGGANPRAGCCFVYRNSTQNPKICGYTSFPLEKQGPTAIEHPQTSNRAELRAVIAAMRFRVWTGEGCRCLVIATDSEYVVEGMTKWVKGWMCNNWKTSTGAPVKNKDLWECLLGEVERWNEEGMRIQFWRIPREWNTEADQHAKVAATKSASQEFGDIHGVLV